VKATGWWIVSIAVGMGAFAGSWLALELWVRLDRATVATVAAVLAPLVAAPFAFLATQTRGRAARGRLLEDPDSPPPRPVPGVFFAPAKNHSFVGRDGALDLLRQRLVTGPPVQALSGRGGGGKTQLAVEYSHRFADMYDVVWWIDAEQPDLIADQMAVLAVRAHVAEVGTATPDAVAAIKNYLRNNRRWLLVFDNAQKPDDIRDWLPGGTGHVIVTSVNPIWTGVAATFQTDVFTRAESIALLKDRVSRISDAQAAELALAMEDLPLGVATAAAYLATTGMPVENYMNMLGASPQRALSPLAALISISLQQLEETDSVALAIIRMCSLFAPEPIPVIWFANPPSAKRPPALRSVDEGRLYDAAGALNALGLASAQEQGLLVPRLTQAVISGSFTAAERKRNSAAARAVVVATRPHDPADPHGWPVWQQLLPHLLALDPAASDNDDLRQAAVDAAWYQARRGDDEVANALAERLYTAWRSRLGDAHGATIAAAAVLARPRPSGRRWGARRS
jgi:hypothetical protein